MPSLVKTLSLTANDIIAAALRKSGVYQSGEPAQPEEIEDGRMALNLMLKSWPVRGVDIQWRQTITVFLSAGIQSYQIGDTGDHATASYFETTLATPGAAGDTMLTLTSTSGISSADFIGIRLDDGTLHWSIVNSLGTLIGSPLPSPAAAGNAVYTYTTKAHRPLKVIYSMRRDGDRDVEVTTIGDTAYQGLSLKGSSGPVNQINYQRSNVNGTLRVWPTGAGKLVLVVQNEPDTFVSLTDTPDCSAEWYEPMIYGLAVRVAPDYGLLSAKEMITLRADAAQMFEDALNYDVENASVIFAREAR